MTASATSQDALHALLREVLPPQGGWSDEGYLWLTDRCNRLVEKRADYAEAGIPEYWIVDPRDETVTVLALEGDAYVGHGVFAAGDSAASRLLEGFAADVTAVFDAPKAGAWIGSWGATNRCAGERRSRLAQ
jgi:hypothetical protein